MKFGLRHLGWRRLIVAWLPAVWAAWASPGTPLTLTPGQKQLFLDDFAIQQSTGLQEIFHPPQKRGPVLKADIPSDGRYIYAVSSPMWIQEEGRYKWIYETRHQAPPSSDLTHAGDVGFRNRYALAVSKDGLHWDKPNLGLVEFGGSRANNLFPTPNHLRLWHVVHDPDDADPGRRYKGFVMEQGGHRPVVSPDGLNWRIEEGAPLLPSGDASTLTYDRRLRRFLAVLKFNGEFGRSYNLYVSRDFRSWEDPRFLFSADAQDQELALEIIRRRLADPSVAKPIMVSPDPALGWKPPADFPTGPNTSVWNAQIYNLGVFPYEGLYIGWFQLYYPTGLSLPERRNTDGFNLIQAAMSRDLESWKRLGNRQAFIGPSRLDQGLIGNYDRLQLGVTNRPLEHETELWFYYGGMKRRVPQHDRYTDGSPRHPSTLTDLERADWIEDTLSAMHLAVLRRDGFVSLRAGDAGGVLLTRPLVLSGDQLYLNLSAAGGRAWVEILDTGGKPVAGFSRDEAQSLGGDSVRAPASWAGGSSIRALAGRTVQLQIHLRNSDLYAFWVE